MAANELRLSQLITTFGPGAMVDLPDYSVVISGLNWWNFRQGGRVIEEPRLAEKVSQALKRRHIEFRTPPPNVDRPDERPKLVDAFQFPQWFLTQDSIGEKKSSRRSRRLIPSEAIHRRRWTDSNGNKHHVVPVRFVRACPKGHLGDIDWKYFVHGEATSCTRELWIDEYGTSGDLSDVWVRCSCGASRPMSEASRPEKMTLGLCDGFRPWLGKHSHDASCRIPNRLLIRTASNAYFPQLLSVISIPETENKILVQVKALWDSGLVEVDSIEALNNARRYNAKIRDQLTNFGNEEVLAEIEKYRKGESDTDNRLIKEREIETLQSSELETSTDTPGGDFFARKLPRSHWESDLTKGIEDIILVHRLREVVALVGFTRFEAKTTDKDGELDIKVAPMALGKGEVDWVPAYENRGEGIFISFKKGTIAEWAKKSVVQHRNLELGAGFANWQAERDDTKREYPGCEYIFLHSLSHMLITSFSLECGYASSSIKERIYAGSYGYGILLYTGTPDAEGTLGGLVEAGRDIKRHIEMAIESNMLCSNDPVCAQHDVTNQHDSRFLLGAACHGCLLISETSCEQHNDFLDRSLVVPTVQSADAAFFGNTDA